MASSYTAWLECTIYCRGPALTGGDTFSTKKIPSQGAGGPQGRIKELARKRWGIKRLKEIYLFTFLEFLTNWEVGCSSNNVGGSSLGLLYYSFPWELMQHPSKVLVNASNVGPYKSKLKWLCPLKCIWMFVLNQMELWNKERLMVGITDQSNNSERYFSFFLPPLLSVLYF